MSNSVLIVEDNLEQLHFLEDTILSEYPNWRVHTASDFSSAKALLTDSVSAGIPYTLFLMDIQLTDSEGDRGGFVLSERIRSYPIYYRTPILFLTSVSDGGPTALSQFHCYNYIAKPYTGEDLIRQIRQMLLTGYLDQFITIQGTDRIAYKLAASDVEFVTSQLHVLHIHAGRTSFDTREYTLSQIHTLLGNDFIQCNKSCIVRKNLIANVDQLTMMLGLRNGQSYPIGRKYLDPITKCL